MRGVIILPVTISRLFTPRSRRVMMSALVLCAVVLSAASVSSAGRTRTIGVIVPRGITAYEEIHRHFVTALEEKGYGRNSIRIIVQRPAVDQMSIVNSARKFVAVDVDIIVTHGAMAALAAVGETRKIPIVFSSVFDPEGERIASGGLSLKRNVTGISSTVPADLLLGTMRRITPLRRIAVLYSSGENNSNAQRHLLKRAASAAGLIVTELETKERRRLPAVLSAIKGDLDAVYITSSSLFAPMMEDIAEVARKRKVPVVSMTSGTRGHGVFLSIFADPVEQGRVAAEKTAKILEGASPRSIPVDSPKMIDIVIDMNAADALGLEVPPDLLDEATEIIR